MRRVRSGLQHSLIGALFTLMSGFAAAQTVSQSPLNVGESVPGNLLLVPSVEYPTLDSVANLNAYTVNRAYAGYFDPAKCYAYSYNNSESQRHFYPTRVSASRTCTVAGEWSGNYLNWAATQTIDPFRKALTGGYRVRDTTTETWVEKAWSDGSAGGIYPNRRIPNSNDNRALVEGATPFSYNNLTIRIATLGNKMRFTYTGDVNDNNGPLENDSRDDPSPYNPANTLVNNRVYEVSVRVKVCDPSLGVTTLEPNCEQYGSNYKPEGLIQKYSDRIRYSVFGYLNDSAQGRDGGVLRAKQKFVGENKFDPDEGLVANDAPEWDPDTGVLYTNPDSADASATNTVVAEGGGAGPNQVIRNSGVINYINKFGQMTGQNHKSLDPVSELYYAAIRYLKHQGNVASYSSLSGTATQRYTLADGFPVITQWDDPIQYWCQNNAILGIGDVNTHNDKNLPGNARRNNEPATAPQEVRDDTTVNVVTATTKVFELEGLTTPLVFPFSGRENSAYIAGLAYDSHTKDFRDDLEDKQTVSTYWVDVREGETLLDRRQNQYWLAAKYGGFDVPEDFEPYDDDTDALDPSWWSIPNDTLTANNNVTFPRAANFYVASDADKMVESLTRAFAKIVSDAEGSGSSLAANSTRLETGTTTFQAQFFAPSWRGDLKAYAVDEDDGSLSDAPIWQAGSLLEAAPWASRRIYVHNSTANTPTSHVLFNWNNLSAAQKTALGDSQAVADYLRGNRAAEESRGGTLRTRTGVLGDIVNSTPVYVGAPNARLYAGATFSGASDYADFVTDNADRPEVVYVGANDGMLHAFLVNGRTIPDGNDTGNEPDPQGAGTEIYAFVPYAAIENGLADYSDPEYEHKYFVDGEIAIADVYDDGEWKTVLVGTLGRGGPGVFALDITDPDAVEFLWEKRGTDVAALGKNIGRPVIAQVADGDWRVLLGNGIDSTDGSSRLVMLAIDDGAATEVNTMATGDNGLSAVLARDSDGDGFADIAYAGDLQGNLWKFSDLGGSPNVRKMFQALDGSLNPQPITAAPLVGRDPATGRLWVFFGTGRYLNEDDVFDMQIQSWYGLKDTGASISGRGDLVEREILDEVLRHGVTARSLEEGTVADLENADGWYIDLESPVAGAQGERMIVPNRFQGAALIGTTRIPERGDACRPSGKGFIMAINPFTGARLDATFFDVNRDGEFDGADMMSDGGSVPVSGIGFNSSPNNPIFVEDVMQVSLDDGTTETIQTQGSSVQASRMSWRELLN